MQKIISFLKKYKNVIKGILFISILILVLIEFSHMRKTVSFSAVKDILSHLSILQILSLLILGILAVSPMMLYDYILTKELGKKISVFKLIENSWTINSLNNLIGFAGIIDLGLRYSYFSEEEEGDKTMQGISKVMPYFMSGLSLLSFISLLLVFSYNANNTLKTYSFVLALASLILPVLLFLSTRKNLDYFGNLSIKKILALIGTSLLDWLFVSGFFFYVGRVLGYNVSFVNIIPLYCISICIGIVSMIPGSLGSFDLIMIGGLLHLSLNHNEAASWLLLFRIFYYFIPFFIGLILFIKSMGGQINDKFLGLPGKLSNIISRGMLHFMANFFGFFLMASAILPDEIHNIPIIGKMDPIHGQLLFQFPSFLLGSLFFLLGRFIKRHSAFTKPFSIVLCPISLIYINLGDCSVFGSLYILVFLILLYTERNRLNRKAFFYPLEDRIKDIGYIVSSFIVTVFLLYVSRGNTGGNSLGFQLFHHNGFFSSASIGTHFFNGFFIRFLHLFAYLLIIAFFYIAVESMAKDRHFTFGEKIEKSRYKAFLESFDNTNLNASLAFLGDKLIYYYSEDNKDLVAFQFALEDGKAVVMGDPIGRSEYFNKAVSAFIKDAEDKNLIPLFYEISQDITLLLHNFGYDFMKFGETAKVDLTEFGLVGKSGRKFRAITNRGENSGYSFKVEFPPFSNNFLDELKNISDNWLLGRQEKGFSLGYFDRDYLSLAPIACVLDDSGNIQAFANFLVCNNDNESSIDLMRYDPKTEKNGIMDYLFVRIFLYMKENNVRYFDLGMAPLSNVGQYDHSFLNEKLAFLVYSFTNRFYSFGGLRKYKEKFAPFWEARYLSFPKDSNLLFDLLTIYKIDNRQVKKN
ncbi:bifunctional lysylphosphatidylglycerol flippase/synthetase MprF [Lachnoanaerobaculum sp. Marseille-Q4761]|uniref:bifunctional lysylphosphatidylglycerol flippase/synthetase MprF n=1 Tax=Lachnoanaerobaculum sp. Marseille-Q4761 TaxID=2819511 RepID=UPI001AA16E2B|nr:bifunctional lysylphosphatidylglycerol flippase/synthetase MprF [Lachnoanaerobaculum sp. Marseille-Q4761]MBO1870999.1 bifunctional lysylphosphatidylglycerol flippase/synthetase MprF [Lachnoanaerobaculum sp. Marseille-Q4761]